MEAHLDTKQEFGGLKTEQIKRLKDLETDIAAGWRRSADGPLLCPFSLLTGNFTGNFAKSWLLARQRL
jgi:hypothetical protein